MPRRISSSLSHNHDSRVEGTLSAIHIRQSYYAPAYIAANKALLHVRAASCRDIPQPGVHRPLQAARNFGGVGTPGL
jgi:hypothetical protein